MTPASSTGYANEGSSLSHANGDRNSLISPRSISRPISGTSASTVYTASRPAKTLSPPSSKQYMIPHNGGPPDLRYSASNYSHANNQVHQWQGSQHHMPSSQYHSVSGGHAQSRNSWDLASYLDTSPAVAASGHGSRQRGSYSSRDMGDGSSLSLSPDDEIRLRNKHHPSQQVSNS